MALPLPVGSIGPNFSAKNVIDGSDVELHELASQYHGVLVNFFRGEF